MAIWNGKPKFNYQTIKRVDSESGRVYDINNENKARYVLINFKAETTIIDQLNELIKFNDHILRHLIINTKLPQTEPSFMNKDQLKSAS